MKKNTNISILCIALFYNPNAYIFCFTVIYVERYIKRRNINEVELKEVGISMIENIFLNFILLIKFMVINLKYKR